MLKLALTLALAAAQTNIATKRVLTAAAKASGAVALDGTPFIYYVAPGAETQKFVIYQKGGCVTRNAYRVTLHTATPNASRVSRNATQRNTHTAPPKNPRP